MSPYSAREVLLRVSMDL